MEVGENVTEIGRACFLGCTRLTEIRSRAKEVPGCSASCFEQTGCAKGTLYVRNGLVLKYRSNKEWSSWGNICLLEGEDAEEQIVVLSGNCGKYGDNVTFSIYDNGLLRIEGNGEMMDVRFDEVFGRYDSYSFHTDMPWWDIAISDVQIGEGVTYVGNHAFHRCKTIKNVAISSTVTAIGIYAFSECNAMTEFISYATEVPLCGVGCFVGGAGKRNLYVKKEILDKYRTSFEWSTWSNFYAVEDHDAILTPIAPLPTVSAKAGGVNIAGQPVSNTYKGIVISHGKKILCR